ncbi:MAG: hypothetical protein ACPGVX_05590 [Thalassobaculaceae bacterium]
MSAWIAPAPRDWPGRARWLADAAAGKQVTPDLCESPQAAALLVEMARVFCAGAWPSAVILAQAVIDAELAARLAAGRGDPMALNAMRFGADFGWLRDRRNRLIHGSDDEGRRRVLTLVDVADGGGDQAAWERDARRAAGLVFDALAG